MGNRVVDLTHEHIDDFVSRPIRPEDIQEWADGSGTAPAQGLRDVLDREAYARALVLASGETVVIWGCETTHASGVGTLWLIGSDLNTSLTLPLFHEFYDTEWAKVEALAPVLQAYTSEKNPVHHRWLAYLGFKKVRTVKSPGSGVNFLRYVRRRPHV